MNVRDLVPWSRGDRARNEAVRYDSDQPPMFRARVIRMISCIRSEIGRSSAGLALGSRMVKAPSYHAATWGLDALAGICT
jgi:hypothetical protein